MFEDSSVVDESAVEKKDPTKEMSDAMREAIKSSIMSGIAMSIVSYLYSTSSNSEDVKAKLKTVVNAFVAGGDLPRTDSDWMVTNYLDGVRRTAVTFEGYGHCEDSGYFSWYTAINAMLNDDSVRSRYFGEEADFTAAEKELIGRYNKARSEYYAAESAFTAYVTGANRLVMSQILLKYGTTFQQTVPEWHKRVLRCAGINANEECEE